MLLRSEIRRPGGSGIESVLGDYTPQQPEEGQALVVAEGGYDYRPLLGKLEKYLDVAHDQKRVDSEELLKLWRSVTVILTPGQINTFLQMTAALDHKEKYAEYAGKFINMLIANSYEAGSNNFTLDMENLGGIDCVATGLIGTEERKIIVRITGKAGNDCGGSHQSIFNIQETGDWCGLHANNSLFTVGKTGDSCGYRAHYSIFNIREAGNKLGNCATGSTFTVDRIGDECGYRCNDVPHFSTFRTANPETLQKMLKDVPEGNRVVRILPGQKELIVRDYNDAPR